MVTILIIIYFISSMTNSKKVVIFSGVLSSLIFYPETFFLVLIISFSVSRFRRLMENREVSLSLIFLILISLKNTFLPIDIKGDFLGISFVLFQVCYFLKKDMSTYTIVSRLSFFPQMYCGPIVKPSGFDRNKKLNIRSLSLYHVIFSTGLFYKSYITYITHYVYTNDNSLLNSIFWWAYMYSDFLSWSLMGIGVSGLAGFKLPISFKAPFFSKNISQFYRRWNITIFQWCQDFIRIKVYNKLWAYINLAIATSALALWHGFGYNFILFGIVNLFYFILQNRIKRRRGLLWFSQILYYATIGFVFNGFIPSHFTPMINNDSYCYLWLLSILAMLFFDYKSFSLVRGLINRYPYLIIISCQFFVAFTFFYRKISGQFYYAQF